MVQPFVGEVRMVGFSFAPVGWAKCDGQLLAINQYDALFSLLGTTYGGDGRTTFGLPDLRGRIPIHDGSGPGLSTRRIGAKGGAENVTLTASQTGSHSHTWQSTSAGAQNRTPVNNALAETGNSIYSQSNPPQTPANMSASMVQNAGQTGSHENVQPFLAIQYCISLFGIYPSRT